MFSSNAMSREGKGREAESESVVLSWGGLGQAEAFIMDTRFWSTVMSFSKINYGASYKRETGRKRIASATQLSLSLNW